MPEIFDNGPDEDEFTLPGDEATLARINGARDGDEPDPAAPVVETPAATAPAPAGDEPAAPVVEEPAAEPVTIGDVTIDDPVVLDYLSRNGGDLAKALKSAAHQTELLGRQGQELGELRRLVEERIAVEQQQVVQQPQYDQDALEEWFADNPTRIPEVAEHAFYQGNEQLLDAAVSAWEEIDRPAARRFERQVAVAQARREVYADAAVQQQQVAGWNEVAEQFAQAHPDLDQVAPRMREIASEYPNIVSTLQTGTPQSKLEVLEFLYEKASRGQATDTRELARTIAREQAHAAEEAITEAAVASAATAPPVQAGNVQERIADAWDKADAPYRDGWNV